MNDRFLKACRREPVDCTPVWFMRQAGRYMSEYRALRAKHSMLDLCKTPELAAQVTMQPIDRFPLDAAIIFADILLPLEPMGLNLEFAEGEGPVIHNPVRDRAAVERLKVVDGSELDYVAEAIRQTRRALNGRVPLIGFAGAPFTLASYAIEGGSSRNYLLTKQMMYRSEAIRQGRRALKGRVPLIGFAGAPFTLASYAIEGGSSRNYLLTKQMMYCEPKTWHLLMDKFARVITGYLRQQIKAGAQAIQLFDSWVGCLSVGDYVESDRKSTR